MADSVLGLEPDFIGLKDDDDDVTRRIKIKKQAVQAIILKKRNILKEDDFLDCPPIVDSNHVNKIKKSVVSSSESVYKSSRNLNKRSKRMDIKTAPVEPIEISLDQNLEITTPTFNLTSTPKSRHSSGRKNNVLVTDPIFKIPFKLGWKRELVFRTTGESGTNRINRSGDVYYYSPNNRKLRSLREIQEYLDLSYSDDHSLNIDCFTFLKQPVGVDDHSKEIIRDANTKLSKEKYFASTDAAKPKKTKGPSINQEIDSEQSDYDGKSSTKMNVVFKNVKKGSKSNKDKRPYINQEIDSEQSDYDGKSSTKMKVVFNNVKNRSESNKNKSASESLPSSSTPAYVSEDCKAIQSSEALIPPPFVKSEVDDQNYTDDQRRSTEINGSLRKAPDSGGCMQSFSYMMKSMRNVFRHLHVHELLSTARVCTGWNMIATDRLLWQNVRLKNSMVYDWNAMVDTINMQRTVALDMRQMLMPTKYEEYRNFWISFSEAIKRATVLKKIELYRCPVHVIKDIVDSLPQLEVLIGSTIKNDLYMKDSKSTEYMPLDLSCLFSARNLTVVRLKGLSGMKVTNISTFKMLPHLRTLSLTSIKSFPKEIFYVLETVTVDLEYLELGDIEFLGKRLAVSIRRLVCLRSLRLENCCGDFDKCARDIFEAIRSLKNLKILELINIELSATVQKELEQCHGIHSLLIFPIYINQAASANRHLIDCLEKLSNTILHLCWGLTFELLRVTEIYISEYQPNLYIGRPDGETIENYRYNIPILKARKPKETNETDSTIKTTNNPDEVDILSVSELQKRLDTMMVNAKSIIIKVPQKSTTRIYLSTLFHDLK